MLSSERTNRNTLPKSPPKISIPPNCGKKDPKGTCLCGAAEDRAYTFDDIACTTGRCAAVVNSDPRISPEFSFYDVDALKAEWDWRMESGHFRMTESSLAV